MTFVVKTAEQKAIQVVALLVDNIRHTSVSPRRGSDTLAPMSAAQVKLGSLLLHAGLLTGEQIEAVLKSQLFFGGRFGTNAVEAEYVTLDAVAGMLAEQLGVPEAPQQALLAAPPAALQCVPAPLCAKYKVFPLRVEGKLLHLAMIDPRDLRADDELSFTLGVRIKPYVVPELRLLYHLERAYGIPREARFLRLASGGPRDPRRRYLAPSAPSAAPARPAAAAQADPADELVFLDAVARTAPLAVPAPASGGAPPRVAAPAAEDEWRESTDVPMDFDGEPLERQSFDDGLAAIARAATRDEVVSAIAAAETVPGALQVLFVTRGEMATAAAATGSAAAPDEIRRLVVSLAAGSLLRTAFVERQLAMSRARTDPVQYVIASVLRAPTPDTACAAPICLGDRAVNLLCIQVPAGGAIDDAAQAKVRALCEAAAAAYLRLIRELKGK